MFYGGSLYDYVDDIKSAINSKNKINLNDSSCKFDCNKASAGTLEFLLVLDICQHMYDICHTYVICHVNICLHHVLHVFTYVYIM